MVKEEILEQKLKQISNESPNFYNFLKNRLNFIGADWSREGRVILKDAETGNGIKAYIVHEHEWDGTGQGGIKETCYVGIFPGGELREKSFPIKPQNESSWNWDNSLYEIKEMYLRNGEITLEIGGNGKDKVLTF